MFVAGFIGSPQMNFVMQELKNADEMHLLFGKQDIKLPEGKAKKLESSEYVAEKW